MYFQHPFWTLHVQKTTIQYIFCSRCFSTSIVRDIWGHRRGSIFHQFALEYGFQYHISNPYHPRSITMAEKEVQTIKNLLKKATEDGQDFHLAILDLRNTPISEDMHLLYKDSWEEDQRHCYQLLNNFYSKADWTTGCKENNLRPERKAEILIWHTC